LDHESRKLVDEKKPQAQKKADLMPHEAYLKLMEMLK